MAQRVILFKPASGLCNMRCTYCFYEEEMCIRSDGRSQMMTREVAESILEQVFKGLAPGDSVQFAFQGGEPTLRGLPFFRFFAEKAESFAEGREIAWSIQTNGTLLTEEWLDFLKEKKFLVGISIDGFEENHDRERVDQKGRGTYSIIRKALDGLRERGVETNVLCVLTKNLARYPKKFYRFLKEEDIRAVQLIPCLSPLEDGVEDAYSLTPELFASFYKKLFWLWREDLLKKDLRNISFFDSLLEQIIFGRCSVCGMNGHCSIQCVVEADGRTYPCDFYCLPEYEMGLLQNGGLQGLDLRGTGRRFLMDGASMPLVCRDCPARGWCGAGCKRMRKNMYSADGIFCGMRSFLEECGEEMENLARLIMDQRR